MVHFPLHSHDFPWFQYFPYINFREDTPSWGTISRLLSIYSIAYKRKATYHSATGKWTLPAWKIEQKVEAISGAKRIFETVMGKSALYIFTEGVVDFFFPKIGSNGDGSISFVSCDPYLTESLKEISKLIVKQEPAGRVHVLVPSTSGVSKYAIGLGAIPLEKSNYRPEVLTAYDRIVKDLNSPDPFGRLAILSGPTGTGKTYLIRALMGELPNIVFLLLPSNMTASLSGPEILSALIDASEETNCTCEECVEKSDSTLDDLKAFFESKDMVPYPTPSNSKHSKKRTIALVIEDADECLSNRASDNISAISAVLNLSDGIIGNCLDLRIICTTNQEIENIDTALLRSGRLSEHIEVGLLDVEQAKAVYQRIGGIVEQKWSKKFYPLSDIYAMAKNGVPLETIRKKASVGFSMRRFPLVPKP
jgi:hypothetical protein